MLATIISDTFRRDESGAIADAIEDICSANDTYGFSSAAIYFHWSIKPRDILYIGPARNISSRFK